MREFRQMALVSGADLAAQFGCSPSHISRVERGWAKPSRELVQFYEDTFDADGLLWSLYEMAAYANEQNRRRVGRQKPVLAHPEPGDASRVIGDTIPHGMLMKPGGWFEMQWQIENAGSVPWMGRRLERQGPLTGPGLIRSKRYVAIPATEPEEVATIAARLRAPSYDCSSIAYFKMVKATTEGLTVPCFPDDCQLDLDVLVRVGGNEARTESLPDGSSPSLFDPDEA